MIEDYQLLEAKNQDDIAQDKFKVHGRTSMKFLNQRHMDILTSNLPQTGDILEVGSGLGKFLQHMAASHKRTVVGIDVSQKCVTIANERLTVYNNSRVRSITAGVEDVKSDLFKPDAGQFSAVVMRGVVHHLPSPKDAFIAIQKVAVSGAKLIILEGNAASPYRSFVLGVADLLNMQHEASNFPHIPPQKLSSMLHDLGYTDIRVSFVSGLTAPAAYQGWGGETVLESRTSS